jgi:hypothetical protein
MNAVDLGTLLPTLLRHITNRYAAILIDTRAPFPLISSRSASARAFLDAVRHIARLRISCTGRWT